MPLLTSSSIGSLQDSNAGTSSFYQGVLSISAGQIVSDPIFISAGIKQVTCGITPGNASAGRIEYTLSPPDSVIADTAIWWPWAAGDVMVGSVDVLLGSVTALRCVVVSGTLTFEIVGS